MEKDLTEIINPDYYNDGEISCIDAMIAAKGIEKVKAFCECCVFKYDWRLGQKDAEEQEVGKMKWYLDKYLELKEDDLPNFKYNELGEVVTDDEGNVVMEEQDYPHEETLAEAIERKEAEFYTALMKQGLSRRQIDNLLGKCD